jgi:hypothetical protein
MKILFTFFIISFLFLSFISFNITDKHSNGLTQNDYNKALVEFRKNRTLLLTRKSLIINNDIAKIKTNTKTI